jgi:hypothetical protein
MRLGQLDKYGERGQCSVEREICMQDGIVGSVICRLRDGLNLDRETL